MTATANKSRDDASWLGLVASPTSALMALVTASSAQPLALCGMGGDVLPIDGMTMMYALMSIFHLPAWIKFARRG